METLGLTQHVLDPTHKLGNSLDIIYTESLETMKVLHEFIGGYASDHKLVGIEINLRKPLPINITTRKRDNNKILGKQHYTK